MKLQETQKIALVSPLIVEPKTVAQPVEYIGFGYLSAVLRSQGYRVDIIDPYLTGDDIGKIVENIVKESYDILGFTLMSVDYYMKMQKILQYLKETDKAYFEKVIILAGGYYTTLNADKILEECEDVDYLISGEGEYPLSELVNCIFGKDKAKEITDIPNIIYRENGLIKKNTRMPLIENLDQLPFPSRDTLAQVLQKGGVAQVSSSRGCYGSCDYCAVHDFYSHFEGSVWRARSPQNVVEEIEGLINNYGIDYIHFLDEDFIGPGKKGRDRAFAFADLLIEKKISIHFYILTRANNVTEALFKKLKEAGLDSVFLGIEFGCQRMLDFYNKKTTVEQNMEAIKILKALDIKVTCGYIMFEPLMTLEEFRQNFDFYMSYVPEFNPRNLTTQLFIYPQTLAHKKLQKDIQIQEQAHFHPVIGSYHVYQFREPKVFVLFQALRDLLSPFLQYTHKKKVEEMKPEDKSFYLSREKNAIGEAVYGLLNELEALDVQEAAKTLPSLVAKSKEALLNLPRDGSERGTFHEG